MPLPSASAVGGGAKKKKTKKSKKKGLTLGGSGSGGGPMQIKIKPFARPPALPPRFAETSTAALLRALDCVLREEPLYVDVDNKGGEEGGGRPCASPKSAAEIGGGVAAADAAGAPMDIDGAASTGPVPVESTAANPASPTTKKRRPVSREELYRLVEDLVAHGHGPQLYGDVVRHVDGAARTCLGRLVGSAPGCVSIGDGGCEKEEVVVFVRTASGGSSGTAGAPSAGDAQTVTMDDGAAAPGAAPASASDADADADSAVLSRVHAVVASYYEYLRCVRSVFLHLDRRFVYLPGAAGGDWKR